MTEEDVVRDVTAALRKIGCKVLRTGVKRARHSNCTPGTPDLLVRRSTWPRALWLGMECKASEKAARSEKQAEFAEAGAIAIVWSVDMAIEAVRSI